MKRIIALFALLGLAMSAAEIPEQDTRNTYTPDYNTHVQMPVFTTREAWLERAAFLRKQILSSAGLLPMPEKAPVHAEVYGRLERDGYSIEKVLLETYPGFYLGGNLYRPRGKQGPFPGVASPHGHWAYGRLENQPLASVPGRCINLARQGFVVFTYDMIGYNDTTQAPHGDRAPRFAGPRESLWSISAMGMQLWDSIRAVDFLTSLPDVDASRIAATGASGGGTQTFLLMAVEDRIKAAAPVNMISAYMQGDNCEEAANLRLRANNMMFGAMMAPRPLLLVSASGDWTRHTPNEEFPAIQSIYRLLGAEQNVENVHVDSVHNYNKQSREAVYTFFGAKLLGATGPVTETRYQVEQIQDVLALYGRQRPANAVTHEQLIANLIADAKRGIEQLRPRDAESLTRAREAFRERLAFSIMASKPAAGDVICEKQGAPAAGEMLLLGRRGMGDHVPAMWLAPGKPNPEVAPTLVVHPDGVAWLRRSAEDANGLVKGILNRGGVVLGIDAFQTGGAQAPRKRSARDFTVFNQTDDANRVQDILTALAYLQGRTKAPAVNLVGLEMGGVWSCFARALAGQGVNLAADLAQFPAETDQEYLDKFFIPGLRKAGDFRAAVVLDSQGRLLLHNAGGEFPVDWLKASSPSADVRTGRASETELLAWVAPEPPPAKTRRGKR